MSATTHAVTDVTITAPNGVWRTWPAKGWTFSIGRRWFTITTWKMGS